MKFAFFDHQGKGAAFRRALDTRYEVMALKLPDDPRVDFVFTDSDLRARRKHLERLKRAGARSFFVYPHAAGPNLVNDIEPAWEGVTAHFVTTRAQRKIMVDYGYPRPIHDVGWSLCELREFQQRPRLQNVLFAPIHHRSAAIDQLANREAFERLAPLALAGEIVLTVRHYKGLETTGIERIEHDNIQYVETGLTPETEAIDAADVVVAHQTYLYLAVARGVPAVGFGTWVPSHIVPGTEVHYAPNWNNYVRELAYPLDIAFGDPLDRLWTAIEGSRAVCDWRERMIGGPFDPDRFLAIVEDYLR
jgi:hypothetical protein